MRIRFLKDAVYETEGPGRGPRFEAGSVHEMREDLARRWIHRQLAEEVTAAPRPTRPSRPPRPPAPQPAAEPTPAPQAESPAAATEEPA